MSQLMIMMGDIKRQIGTCIPSNTENNPRSEGKEEILEAEDELESDEQIALVAEPEKKDT
ncbi:acidic leucine-rich nuclear phosphoprotein 32 family member B-like [Gossypium australe]|uniref:Acidic leucine-rich nuclear phosphoprotein 32 family member B-like n=1 Tax=Gossypium australe TaxID=47621 RepID=A0A5B6WXW8_9ROSI|nr:acidic leucine-rich nuclear phosphoprotein 32 family member B-like [Gossypium australe]